MLMGYCNYIGFLVHLLIAESFVKLDRTSSVYFWALVSTFFKSCYIHYLIVSNALWSYLYRFNLYCGLFH